MKKKKSLLKSKKYPSIHEYLEKTGMKRTRFVYLMQIPYVTLMRWFSGESVMSKKNALKIEKLTGGLIKSDNLLNEGKEQSRKE